MSAIDDYFDSLNYSKAQRDAVAAELFREYTDATNSYPPPDMTGVYSATDPNALWVSGNILKKGGNMGVGGTDFRLKGVSLLSTVYENPSALMDTLIADATMAGCNVVRIPIIDTDGGNNGWDQWTTTQKNNHFNNVLAPLVTKINNAGMYAIVDRHAVKDFDGTNFELCKAFWQFMAVKFKGNPMVIYEMFNEPIGPQTYPFPGIQPGEWLKWRDMYQPIVDLIRFYAPYNLITLGSTSYSSRSRYADSLPFTGFNLMYTLHYYANREIPSLAHVPTNQLKNWLIANFFPSTVPIFLTEFGYSTGHGLSDPEPWNIDITDRTDFKTEMAALFAERPDISYTMWSWGTNSGSLSMLASNGADQKAWLSTLLALP